MSLTIESMLETERECVANGLEILNSKYSSDESFNIYSKFQKDFFKKNKPLLDQCVSRNYMLPFFYQEALTFYRFVRLNYK